VQAALAHAGIACSDYQVSDLIGLVSAYLVLTIPRTP
jgi:hypothetical protein